MLSVGNIDEFSLYELPCTLEEREVKLLAKPIQFFLLCSFLITQMSDE